MEWWELDSRNALQYVLCTEIVFLRNFDAKSDDAFLLESTKVQTKTVYIIH